MTYLRAGDLGVEGSGRVTKPKPAPSRSVERSQRLGTHLGLIKRMPWYTL